MSIAASVQNLVPSIERNGNFIRDTWDRMAALPGGKRVFSRLVGVAAPYTGSMGAHINVAVAYTLPDDARFIVAGMSIDYLKKARGTITGHATCPLFRDNEKAEHEIVVTLTDRKGEEVARGRLRTLVGPKKQH
jgi:hypothetical protein